MTLSQRREPIRSKKILNHAKGQPCTLRLLGICNSNPETTVAAHIRDQHKGMGIKASDHSIVFACSDCHRELDEGAGDYRSEIIRAMQETWAILIADGIVIVQQDIPARSKSGKRKPKSKMQSRGFQNSNSKFKRKINGTVERGT